MDFSGRHILITGAASGIGLACAQWLAARGAARLILTDIDGAALAQAAVPGTVERVVGDVGDEAHWDAVAARLDGLDHAVLNAGVGAAAPIAEATLAEWRRVLAVNLDGVFLGLRTALRTMRDGGSIVATASAAGIKAEPGIAAYATSKAGVIQLVKVAAKEAAPRRIRVNAVAPAGVETPIWDKMEFFDALVEREGSRAAAFAAMAAAGTPLGRYARADEVAAQIGFLLSDAAATMTGTTLLSDGGYTL